MLCFTADPLLLPIKIQVTTQHHREYFLTEHQHGNLNYREVCYLLLRAAKHDPLGAETEGDYNTQSTRS